MKREVSLILLSAFLLFLIPTVSAEMFISQPKTTYNIGDDFSFNVTIVPSSDANGFFIAEIECSGESSGSVEIYRVPLSLKIGNQKVIEISGKFENFLTEDLGGTCYLSAMHEHSRASTSNFEIARKVYVSTWTDKIIINPNDRINVSGKGIKTNGQLVTKGFVELRVSDLNITVFKSVESGQFNIMISIPDDARAGEHSISARIYEKDGDGKITNEGEGNTTIKINQVIRKSEIAISAQAIEPENEFIYTALLHDQSGENIAKNVDTSIYYPNGRLFARKVVLSGEANKLTIAGNFTPGTWRIESNADGIKSNRSFYVEEYESADFKLSEGTLTVTNTGNVPYKKPVEVVIGGTSEVEEVDVDVGETKKYALSAPDGQYSISIRDGQIEQELGTSFLTGRAIGVEAEGNGGIFSRSYLFIWIMLIGICALVAVLQYRRVSNLPYYGQTPSSYPAPMKADKSEDGIISEGNREECSIISLKLKNSEDIEKTNGDAISSIERALTRARDARAKIYSDKNYRTMVFAPSLTNEKDNSMKAVAIAKEIENTFNEHNKRYGEKIMFGLGVHSGEMIVGSSKGGEFKFNSIGNTIPYVKKIADSVSHGVGVSEMVHRRILGKVKSDKIEGTNYWRIAKIRDRELHSDFISRFVERQRREPAER